MSKLCVHYELLCNFGPLCESLIERSDRFIKQYKNVVEESKLCTQNHIKTSESLCKDQDVRSSKLITSNNEEEAEKEEAKTFADVSLTSRLKSGKEGDQKVEGKDFEHLHSNNQGIDSLKNIEKTRSEVK